ncbi:Tryptophan 2,3-dioxygenase apoenzyme [Ekhidna lutea]|uniref:Tryptophan 2,3-dioxygenase apoenzyme n=1 Tax=Ekhidna lutea TaxID=447679 RepID=A0A239M716_EKHLU|nr:tryptophan 2,3-dioxygenase family protein [Ekhidna lutea]SNT38535.1 Tryptophan 2,3-dioxygenase apoenzyme [Ekhidna lutea]
MSEKKIDENIIKQLTKLEEKYEAMGQDLSSYLDGLLYSDYLTYWDYIHLDTLLSLQSPRTAIPDEKIFILYHQVTELYFRMILNEMEQITFTDPIGEKTFLKRLKRVNRYLDHLIDSFDVMTDGMDQDQFLAFRMALLPASGFQSAQYRKLEIFSTDFHNLVNIDKREELKSNEDIKKLYELLYWKAGATELATGKKTLTLKQFEAKYSQEFIQLGEQLKSCNILRKFSEHYEDNEDIRHEMKKLDQKANVDWPLQHLKSATRYLQRDPEVIKASGGTNWQKYLPPRRQRIIFYPELWSTEETHEWGQKFKRALASPHA